MTTQENNIDGSQFKPLSPAGLGEILGLTLKRDDTSKVITFLCQLSAYTDEDQFNVSFNAPSSTGKSYIPLEIADLFPQEDVIRLGYCSPASFIHDQGEWSQEQKQNVITLGRKIIIFLDQPHMDLLTRLRPLLSHDQKEICLKITDKTERHGLRTKTTKLCGFPVIVFASAGLKIDEQESTRFLLLSPEMSQEKIRDAIGQRIKKDSNRKNFRKEVSENAARELLKQRIRAIKEAQISEIIIESPQEVQRLFLSQNRFLRPRHSRDIGRVMSLIKSIALLNLWFRKREDNTIFVDKSDIQEGFKLWNEISETQELNLPPYVLDIYKNVILPLANRKQGDSGVGEGGRRGVSRNEIIREYSRIYHVPLPDWKLKREVLPMLEASSLITQEPDPLNRSRILIYPTLQSPYSHNEQQPDSPPTPQSPYSEVDQGIALSGGAL